MRRVFRGALCLIQNESKEVKDAPGKDESEVQSNSCVTPLISSF